jgi:diacylglycerol O-acyltransferase
VAGLDVCARESALVDRPSALDLAFVDLETPQAPLHVGWTMRFGGGAGPVPSVGVLRRHLAARLDAVPRFRRRLVHPMLSGHVWVDDPRFDVARHVFGAELAAPGELREVAGMLLSQALPDDRPLWRMYLLSGLPDGGFAIVGQAHHALVDGIAAVEVGTLLFGEVAGAGRDGAAGAAPWTPAPGPSEGAALGATVALRARAAVGAARELSGAAGALRDTARAVESFARPVTTTALDRSVSRRRAVAFASVPFDVVRDTGRRHGATVNDVLLAATTLALRAELQRRAEPPNPLRTEPRRREAPPDTPRAEPRRLEEPPDTLPAAEPRRLEEPPDTLPAAELRRHEASPGPLRADPRHRAALPDTLRTLVPVSVRTDEASALGNRISFLAVELPVGEPDPRRVLALLRARTTAAKDGGDAGALESLARAADALPGAARRLLTRSAARAVGFNLVVSNVPGPPMPLSLLGHPLVAIHPMVPLLHGHALTIGAVSYAGQLHLGLAADASVVPGIATIARDLERSFSVLRGAPSAIPVAGASDAAGKSPLGARAQGAANR